MNVLNRRLLTVNILALLFVGGFAFTVLDYESSAPPQDQTLSMPQAKTLHDNYDRTASVFNDKLEAIYLDRQTIADINALLSMNQNSSGVRIYFGKDAEGNTTNVLVNCKEGTNADDMSKILKSAGSIDVCPNFCDNESGLMRQE